MTDSFRVRVVEFSDRAHYQLQWTCPLDGRKKTKSSGIPRTGKRSDRDKATKAAGNHEKALLAGEYIGRRITWEQFRDRYENDVAKAKAAATASKVESVFNLVEKIINPLRLAHLTAERLSHFQAELRKLGRSEASIKSNLAHLKAALRWAERVGLLAKAPAIDLPKRAAEQMKGRPITGEEFDRMLAAVPKVVGTADAPEFERLLCGLSLSGLRVSEALVLTWDGDGLHVEMEGKRPFLAIPAALEKGNKNRLLPITPDFAAFLAETPDAQRRGRVFRLPDRRGKALDRPAVSAIVSAIGKAAGVKVATHARTGETKFASCHDLRRAFGQRWAAKVMPQVLMELMRHETMQTTLVYYVGKNAERTADAVWAAFENGNTFGNTSPASGSAANSDVAASADVQTV